MLNLTGMIPANVPDRPRKKKSTSAQRRAMSLEESVDVKLTRALAGIYAECRRYAVGHALPLRFVVENNGLSVATPTEAAWGLTFGSEFIGTIATDLYAYKLPWPHSGAGKRVEF